MKTNPTTFASSAFDACSMGFIMGTLVKVLNVGNPLAWGLTYGCKFALHEMAEKVDLVSKNVLVFYFWNNMGALAVSQWVVQTLIPGFTLHPLAWVFQLSFLGTELAATPKLIIAIVKNWNR